MRTLLGWDRAGAFVTRLPSDDTRPGLRTGDPRAFSKRQLSSPNLRRALNLKMSVGQNGADILKVGDNTGHTVLLMTPEVKGR